MCTERHTGGVGDTLEKHQNTSPDCAIVIVNSSLYLDYFSILIQQYFTRHLSPTLYYQVEYREIGMNWTIQSPNTTATYTTLTGLTLATTYEVRVRAVSDVGNGAWSETVSETTFDGQFNLNTCTTLW